MSFRTSAMVAAPGPAIVLDLARTVRLGFKHDDGDDLINRECRDVHVKHHIFHGGKTEFTDNEIKHLKVDHYGTFSATCAKDAYTTCKAILDLPGLPASPSITDACAGCGCNSIQFACCDRFQTVSVVELNPVRFERYLKHNIATATKMRPATHTETELICGNYLNVMHKMAQDVVFLDPPWGGPLYDTEGLCVLKLGDVHVAQIIRTLHANSTKNKTKYVVMKAPHNLDVRDMQVALGDGLNLQCLKAFFHWKLYSIRFVN